MTRLITLSGRHKYASTTTRKDEPWRDAGYVAWLGWGGTTGIEWAREITGAAEDG